MKLNLFSRIVFVVLLAFVVNSFIYFAFGNTYSNTIFNFERYRSQFSSGVYRSRIFSTYVLMWIYDVLSSLHMNFDVFKLKFLDPKAEPKMYVAFYLMNTFFLMLSAVILLFIMETKNFVATYSEKILLISVAIFTMAITQFVVVPYDTSSYFFMLIFYLFFLKYINKNAVSFLIILGFIIVLSTLNRESSALSLSLAATFLYTKYGLKKETILPIAVLGICFLAVYFGNKFFGSQFTTNDGNLLYENFTQPKNYLGILFWIVFLFFSLIIAKDKKSVQLILVFHLLSIPYILMCFYTGILYEVRLYVPLFLSSLLIGRTELSRIH